MATLLRVLLFSLSLYCAFGAQAQSVVPGATGAEAVVRSFHEALRNGNVALVERLLAPDAVIIESGQLESRSEYLRHHLPADIEFAKAVPSRMLGVQSTVNGETAWVRSTSASQGIFRDRPVKLDSAELVVLTRKGPTWEIRAIHWSSHRAD